MTINMEEFSVEAMAKRPPTADEVVSLMNFIDKQVAIEAEIVRLNEALEAEQDKLKQLIEKDIPGFFEQLGLKEMTLADGRTVAVDAKVYASVSEENREAFFAWLKQHDLDGIIKSQITVAFGKDCTDLARDTWYKLKELVGDKGSIDGKQSIHPQTLNSTVRGILEDGKLMLPPSLTTVEVKKSVVKAPKAKGARRSSK